MLVSNRHTGTLEAPAKPISSARKFVEVIELRVMYVAEFPHQLDFAKWAEVFAEIPAVNGIPQGLGIEVIRPLVGAISPSLFENLKVQYILGSVTWGRRFRPLDKTLKTLASCSA
ncbi:hypothetical protein QBC45DRAFT_447513 [Copromyces sp. CBS 386.78]|nr:hypothetical protein QBC45DRAFT_447513 [Copromyces sp. CBS 386.78]